jgi:hypothetical protein
MFRTLALPVLVVAAACQTEAASAPARDSAVVEQEIAGLAETVMDAAVVWDEQGSWNAFSPGTLFSSEGASLPLEEARAGWLQAAAASSRQSLADRLTRVQVLSPDIAVSTMTGTYSSFDSAGVETPKTPYAWTAVWQRQDGRWSMVATHQSIQGAFPGQEPPTAR